MMLMDRAAPGDRERARRLLRQARETYGQIGMRAHREITHTLLNYGVGLCAESPLSEPFQPNLR
jgi:hypothetical protein